MGFTMWLDTDRGVGSTGGGFQEMSGFIEDPGLLQCIPSPGNNRNPFRWGKIARIGVSDQMEILS
jgi:hypothetical protein